MEEVRLQKIIADRGFCSRRKAEEYILQGRVKVNDKVINVLGEKYDYFVEIKIDDKIILPLQEERKVFVFNKPLGVIATSSDDRERKTVIDFFKKENLRLYPVGRLDYNTGGLIFVTNDGEFSQLVTHPSSHLEKSYIVTVNGFVTDQEFKMLHDGVMLEDGLTSPAKVYLGKRNQEITIFKLVIHEGRNRQVRRMCEAINHEVKSLFRESVGRIYLGELKRGEYRLLTSEEVERIKNICKENKKNNVIPEHKLK